MPEKDFSEIAKLSERYNKDPESRIFVQLADAYRKNNMIDEALEVLNNGLRYHPQYPLAYLIMGKCFFDKRMFPQAKESFEKTLTSDPQNIVALRMLAQTCELLQDKEGQIAAYRTILNFDPFDASAKQNFERLAASQKKEPLYTISMAQEYERQHNLSKALEVYEQLLSSDSSDLLLQKKVSELKQKLEEEKKEIKEEKLEGPQLEAAVEARNFRKEPEPSEVAVARETTRDVEKEIKSKEKAEEVLSLEDFLVEETKEKRLLEEPIPAPPEVPLPETKIETTPTIKEELIPKREEPAPAEPTPVTPEQPKPEEKIETAPPIKEPIPKREEPTPAEPTPVTPEQPKPEEKKKEEEPQKTREEDFKSFQDWLSGLVK